MAIRPTGFAQTTGTNNGNVEEVLVFGTQGARESTTGSRLDLTVLETPATVDIIDGDAIRARMDTNVLEAATRSAGFTNEVEPRQRQLEHLRRAASAARGR